MKLHLPIALLTAVLSTFAYGEEVSSTEQTQPLYTYTHETLGDTIYSTFEGNGLSGVYIEGSAYKDTFQKSSGSKKYDMPDSIAGIPYSSTDAGKKAVNTDITITGENTRLSMVSGVGPKGYSASGNKTITITDGAYCSTVYGGSYDKQTVPDASADTSSVITVNVLNGGIVKTVNGAGFVASSRLYENIPTRTVNEKVCINVVDGIVGASKAEDGSLSYKNAADLKSFAIIGGGPYGLSVNNDVEISISGNSEIYSQIYGGTISTTYDSSSVKSTKIAIDGGIINGNVFGGGYYNGVSSVVKEGTLIELTGGTVTGNVYGAGVNDKVYGGTRVELSGDAKVLGYIYGAGTTGNEVQTGDRVITFDNHGDVNWNQIKNFNVVELTGGTSTTLGEDTDHTLSTDFEKVVISGPSTTVTGTIGRPVELHITDDCWVELKGKDGTLTTNADSVIKDNTTKNIVIHGNAHFNGTHIENSTIEADGNIGVSGSTVKDANLVAAAGQISVNNGSTIDGGEITVGEQGLSLVKSDVKVDKINGVDELLLATQNDWSLEVNDDLKLAEGSALRGFGLGNDVWAYGDLKADSVSIESALDDKLWAVNVNATDGDIVIGSSNMVQDSHLTASDSVVLKDGVSLTHGSTATAQTGDVLLSNGVKVENSYLIAKNGSVIFESSTMNGGNIVAGEKLELSASTATVDSINGGNAVKLDMTSAYVDGKLVGSNLNVNGDVVLANGSKIWGAETTEYPFFGKLEGCTSSLTADSITTGEGASDTLPVGAGDFMYAKLEATKGDISIGANNVIKDTDLTAAKDVKLESSKMEGGNINAGGKLVLNNSEVSVNSIGKDGAVVESTNKSKLEVTQGALVLNGGSVVKDSELISKEGVELRGTTMTGSTVKTDGVFSVTKQSNVTMDSVEGLKTIAISDSSFTTGKVELSQGETITSKTSNFTATDLVVNGGNFAADGTIKANSITVSDKGTIQIGDAAGKSKTQMELNATGSQSGLVSGKLEITNTDLVVTGSSSTQFWIDGGTMLVDGKSNVDLSVGTTLRVGSENAGELIVQGGSTLKGGANNLWVYDNSTITVDGGSTMGVCNDTDHYNYRVLMGITNHNGIDDTTPTQNLNVLGGSTFTSSATQFVTNFHGGTTTNITVSGEKSLFLQTGQTVKETHKAVGTTGEWEKVNDKWFDKGSTGVNQYIDGKGDTITYLLSQGTDSIGALGDAVSKAMVNITAEKGGRVQFDSALTYVGNVAVNEQYIEANKSNYATFTVGEGSSMSFKQMEVYANANVKNDGTFSATNINVNNGGIFNYQGGGEMTASSLGVDAGGVMNLVSGNVVLNNAGSGQTGIISGALNVTNTKLEVTGSSSSQFWIDGGTMTVDKGSVVDLSVGTTLRVGNENAGVLNVLGGSTLTGGANNLWVYDNSTINVSGKDSVMGVCNDTDHYNYRVLMGITNHNGAQGSAEQYLNVTDGGKFTSSATQFVTNFHSNTTTNITVSGENSLFQQTGKTVNKNHYVVGTTGEWVEVNGKWLDKGSTGDGKYVAGQGDTITYLLSNGTDKDGVLGYAVADAKVNISAKDGGAVKFDSALTYVGNVGVSDAYIKANESNEANFYLSGANSSISFKEMQMYANTNVNYAGDTNGTFSASKITVNNGATLNVNGNGKDSGSQFILTGTGKSNDEALVVDGHMVVKNANLVMKGSSSQLGIGYNGNGTMEVINSKVDISEGSTLHMGYNAEYTGKLVLDNSQFVGGYNNAWLGGGVLELKNGSTMDVCNVAPKGTEYNYRTILGWDGHDMKVDISGGSTMTSAATQFITNYNSNTNVEIAVDGVGSKLTHKGKTETSKSSYALGYSGEWVEKEVITGYDAKGVAQTKVALADKDTVGRVNSGEGTTETVAYLLDSGTDEFGAKKAAVNNVTTTIKASNGGAVEFGSNKTYVGSVQDKALGYTNKKLNITVADSASSVTFGDMVIYADTTIDNKGDKADFSAGNISVNDGATLETLGSLDLNEVALAGGTLFNAGTLELDSLVLEHASLLFAVSDWETAASTINYKGAELTDFRNLTVSINDMVDSYGIVLTGSAAEQLIAKGDEGFEFSFTLAKGSDLFEDQLAYVLNAEENLADFSITVGDAVLRRADGELKDLKVTDTADGVVISGIAVIPEPTTATLSLLALAALAARRRRK